MSQDEEDGPLLPGQRGSSQIVRSAITLPPAVYRVLQNMRRVLMTARGAVPTMSAVLADCVRYAVRQGQDSESPAWGLRKGDVPEDL